LKSLILTLSHNKFLPFPSHFLPPRFFPVSLIFFLVFFLRFFLYNFLSIYTSHYLSDDARNTSISNIKNSEEKTEKETEKERNSDVHRTITQKESVTYNNSSKVHIEE
jgi:hypothetical protein